MNDKMKLPEGKPQHKKTNHPGIDNSPIVGQPGPTVLDNPAWRQRPSPWPFNPSDTSPLEWWRTLPSDAFHDAECLLLEATLEQVDVLHGGADFAAALEGELVGRHRRRVLGDAGRGVYVEDRHRHDSLAAERSRAQRGGGTGTGAGPRLDRPWPRLR